MAWLRMAHATSTGLKNSYENEIAGMHTGVSESGVLDS